MSYNWMLVRGGSANPSSLKFAALMNKQNIAENELFKPESQQPGIISTHTEDMILLQDPFIFTKLKPKTIHYKGPFEPDGVYLKLWARFNHLALNMKDYSLSGNSIRPTGNPKLCEGPDDGVKGGTIVSKLNHNPDIIDYFEVLNPDEHKLGVLEATTGFSIYYKFMVEGPIEQHNGEDPTLFYHIEDPGGDNGTILKIGTNGQLKFFVKRAGTVRNFISQNNVVTPGIWNVACLKYTLSGDVFGMTVNNIPTTDSADETPSFPAGHQNSIFMGIGTDQSAGRFVGRVADARWYTDLIFSDDHMNNVWNNRRSICAANVVHFNGGPFDGTNTYINCGNHSDLWSQALTKFSFSFWIKQGASNGWRYLNHEFESGGGFCPYDGGGNVNFLITNNANTQYFIATSTGTSILDVWKFISGVYDSTLGSANVKIYVDAILGDITANHTETKNLSAVLTLGHPSGCFAGDMKDFRWWTNKALTEAEIIAVRDDRSDAPIPNYWLKMVEGNGNPVDWITRTKVGTLNNGAVWTIGSSPHPTQFGSLAVAGYSRFNDTVDTGGFDSTGYDATGFDVT